MMRPQRFRIIVRLTARAHATAPRTLVDHIRSASSSFSRRSIRNQNVHLPVPIDQSFDGRVDGRSVTDVEGTQLRRPAARADRVRDFTRSGLSADEVYDDAGALLRESFAAGAAYAARASRYQSYLAVQSKHADRLIDGRWPSFNGRLNPRARIARKHRATKRR